MSNYDRNFAWHTNGPYQQAPNPLMSQSKNYLQSALGSFNMAGRNARAMSGYGQNAAAYGGGLMNIVSNQYNPLFASMPGLANVNPNWYGETAANDVSGQFERARASSGREMTRMGVNPNSGRFAGMDQRFGLAEAAGRASAFDNARQTAQQQRFANNMAVSQLGLGIGQQGLAGTQVGGQLMGQSGEMLQRQGAIDYGLSNDAAQAAAHPDVFDVQNLAEPDLSHTRGKLEEATPTSGLGPHTSGLLEDAKPAGGGWNQAFQDERQPAYPGQYNKTQGLVSQGSSPSQTTFFNMGQKDFVNSPDNQIPGGERTPANYTPIPMDAGPEQRLAWAGQQMKLGNLKRVGTNAYYDMVTKKTYSLADLGIAQEPDTKWSGLLGAGKDLLYHRGEVGRADAAAAYRDTVKAVDDIINAFR